MPTTPTTIQGVSILSRQKKGGTDAFEMVLSHEGIEVRRPDRAAQLMAWDRVSEWEIEERKGFVLLTLRGQGATTPLVVPGWTVDDLELVMREATAGTSSGPAVNEPEPVATATGGSEAAAAAAVAVVAPAAPATSPPPEPEPAPTPVPASEAPVSEAPVSEAPATPTRAERRKRATRGAWLRRLSWQAVVTVVLLGVLATAVIVVLLQSAGIIDWSFLGPVA